MVIFHSYVSLPEGKYCSFGNCSEFRGIEQDAYQRSVFNKKNLTSNCFGYIIRIFLESYGAHKNQVQTITLW